jgi:hypothetical protein
MWKYFFICANKSLYHANFSTTVSEYPYGLVFGLHYIMVMPTFCQ